VPRRRLGAVGHQVGVRLLELCAYREGRGAKRRTEVLDALRFIHSVAWPQMFGKPADDLQQAHACDDEFMITDADLSVCRFVSVPRAYGGFHPGALVAGMVRGMLEAAGFPARVSAHYVEPPAGGGAARPSARRTTLLIKFGAAVMERQRALDRAKAGGL